VLGAHGALTKYLLRGPLLIVEGTNISLLEIKYKGGRFTFSTRGGFSEERVSRSLKRSKVRGVKKNLATSDKKKTHPGLQNRIKEGTGRGGFPLKSSFFKHSGGGGEGYLRRGMKVSIFLCDSSGFEHLFNGKGSKRKILEKLLTSKAFSWDFMVNLHLSLPLRYRPISSGRNLNREFKEEDQSCPTARKHLASRAGRKAVHIADEKIAAGGRDATVSL